MLPTLRTCRARAVCVAVTLLVLAAAPARASPNHDTVQRATPMIRSPQRYLHQGRRLGETLKPEVTEETCEQVHSKQFDGPLRIGFEILETETVPPDMLDHIQNTVLPRATRFWSEALQVRQVKEPLRVERRGVNCMRYALAIPGVPNQVLAAEGKFTCESAEPPICGDEQLRIPDKYIKRTTICSKHCPYFIETFAHLLGRYNGICDNCTTLPEGSGAEGYDFFVFVTIRDGKHCGDWTAAHAASCVTDQCDRPIFAHINFCQSKVKVAPESTDDMVSTAIHELAHALGFSVYHFQFFRNADGSPKAPRNPVNEQDILDSIPWTCNGDGSFAFPDPAGDQRWFDLSKTGVLEKFNERGMDSCPCPVGLPTMYPNCIQDLSAPLRKPSCVFKVVTPKVREKVREHFGCEWLPGAELENQPGTPCTIVGSHWEERIFRGEIMTPGLDGEYTYISPFTLGLFEDSGWYLPNYDMADTLVKGAHWGYKLGCNFATEKCIQNGQTEFPQVWCTSEEQQRCSYDRKGQAACGIHPSPVELPELLQYLPQGLIGEKAELDYCPYYTRRWANRDCTATASNYAPVATANLMREVFGETSRCLESTMRGGAPLMDSDVEFPPDGALFEQPRPACFTIECSEDAASYRVLVDDLHGGAAVLGTCFDEEQTLTSPGLVGEVYCAAPAELCGVAKHPRHTMVLYTKEHVSWQRWARTWQAVGVAAPMAAVLAPSALLAVAAASLWRTRHSTACVRLPSPCSRRRNEPDFMLLADEGATRAAAGAVGHDGLCDSAGE